MKSVTLASPIKVWYKSLPRIPHIGWPIIDLQLSYHRILLPQPVLSLIDSGANFSILHLEIAEALGIDLHKIGKPKMTGSSVSGFYQSWILPEPIEVEIYESSYHFRFEVINNPGLIWPCILGENSIFEVARLDFQKYKGFFEIRFRQDIN